MIDNSGNVQPSAELQDRFSILVDLSQVNWWELREDLLAAVRISRIEMRIKIGLILSPDRNQTAAISMSPFRDGQGRLLEGSSVLRLPYREYVLARRLLHEVEILETSDGDLDFPDIARSECISFSVVSSELALELIEICKDRSVFVAAFRWNESNHHAAIMMWFRLPLKALLAQEELLVDYEGFPDQGQLVGDRFIWESEGPPEGCADGFFYDTPDDLYLESTKSHLVPPPDLLHVNLPDIPASPLQRSLASAGGTVLRISQHDDPNSEAWFELPYLQNQFPDLLAVDRKVSSYCLDPTHLSAKWSGFVQHGYGLLADDSIKLAAGICGALLGPFAPEEAVATSNGELQFSVGVSISSKWRTRAQLVTAWIAEPQKGLRMTTAYVSGGASEYAFAPSPRLPDADIEDVWADILAHASSIDEEWAQDGARARARLFIPRRGASNSLARHLVRSGQSHGDFSRVAVGGRAVLAPVGAETSWLAASAIASFAQIELGLHGIRSMVDVWVD